MITGGELIPIRTGIQEYRHRINLRCDPMTIVMIVSISNYVIFIFNFFFLFIFCLFFIRNFFCSLLLHFVFVLFFITSNNSSIYKIFEIKVKMLYLLYVYVSVIVKILNFSIDLSFIVQICASVEGLLHIWKYYESMYGDVLWLDWCDYTAYMQVSSTMNWTLWIYIYISEYPKRKGIDNENTLRYKGI